MKLPRPSRLVLCCLAALLGAPLAAAPPASAYVAPGGLRWVALETVPPKPGSDELLPTQRLRLAEEGHPGGLVLLEGVRSMCDTTVRWDDDGHLFLRVPEQDGPGLRVRDGRRWGGVLIRLQVHDDQVLVRRPSPDGTRSLLVIEQCESQDWNLYLRRAGEPDYGPAMRLGWGDPQLVGGFPWLQPCLDVEWTGPRSACVVVAYRRNGVTLRRQVAGVRVDWIFQGNYRRPPQREQSLGTLKTKASTPPRAP